MKNILIFGHGFATQFIDISNQYTKLFNKKNYRVTVAYLVGEPSETIRQQHLADEVIFLNCSKQATRGLKLNAIRTMLAMHRKKHFEIVICHRYKPTYIMLWVSLFRKIPLLFSIMHELGTMRATMRKTFMALLSNSQTIFAGVSDAVRDDLRQSMWKIPKERIITLHNMIDVDLTLPEILPREVARQQLNIKPETFLFGTLGRLAINKDQKTLIAAFAKIAPLCLNSQLIIMGDGQLETELKNQVQALQLTDRVIFTGFIDRGFRLVKALDVYISSSIQEAFGRVLLEAMLAKVPIIATAVNGVPEVVGDAGILIQARDTETLAEKMLALYQASTDQLIDLGEKGYVRATQHFSIQRFNEIFWNLSFIQQKELS